MNIPESLIMFSVKNLIGWLIIIVLPRIGIILSYNMEKKINLKMILIS